MTHKSLVAALLLISSHAFADGTCHPAAVVTLKCGSYGGNDPSCPPPAKFCVGPTDPINASLVCFAQGWGVMNCHAYPTSESNIFTYEWKINGIPLGIYGQTENIGCTEGHNTITVKVSDIFGKSATVENLEYCREGYPE